MQISSTIQAGLGTIPYTMRHGRKCDGRYTVSTLSVTNPYPYTAYYYSCRNRGTDPADMVLERNQRADRGPYPSPEWISVSTGCTSPWIGRIYLWTWHIAVIPSLDKSMLRIRTRLMFWKADYWGLWGSGSWSASPRMPWYWAKIAVPVRRWGRQALPPKRPAEQNISREYSKQ